MSVEQPQAVPVARVARPPAPQTPETPFYALLLLLLIACLLGALVFFAATGKRAAVEEWEYKVVGYPDDTMDEKINELGREGWEMVTARRASGGGSTYSYEMIFKRRGSSRPPKTPGRP